MKTALAFEQMSRALPYVAELLNDDAVVDAKRMMKTHADGEALNGNLLTSLLPTFLTRNPRAVYGLLGAIVDKTPEEIAEQEWAETVKLLNAPILDDVMRLFIFAVRMANYA